jgi:hypothetical protein
LTKPDNNLENQDWYKMNSAENESELAKKHRDFDRERNEWCFLKDKQQVKYQSFILLEIIPLEKINQLFDGLDHLYSDILESNSSSLEYRKILSDGQSKLFQTHTLNLPPLVSSKLKGKVLPMGSFHDLGINFQAMDISISHPIPSTTILRINVRLEEELSKKINDIIYKYHEEKREFIKPQNKNLIRIITPDQQKESEIYHLRKSLHVEAINFIRKYFTGYFFELENTIPSIVPSIDLFSFDFPGKDDEIITWGMENNGFFRCFSTYIHQFNCFRHENYLMTFESNHFVEYNNYLIFANRRETVDKMYGDVDAAIIGNLDFCDFDLLAIDRLVKQQESHVGKLNLIISQEIESIQSNDFPKAISNRKKVIQTIFSFERFSVEFNKNRFLPIEFKFYGLMAKPQMDIKKIELFNSLRESIEARIKEIHTLNMLFSQEHETILSLKNLEFNKKMQDIVLVLTFFIIILTFTQVVLLIGQEWDTIMKFFASGISQIVLLVWIISIAIASWNLI